MLEALVFTLKIFPKLIIFSIAGELAFFVLANALAVFAVVSFLVYVKWSVLYIFMSVILFNSVVKLIYYAVVESMRVTFYIQIFYSKLGDLEPVDFTEELGSIAARVPALAPLIKRSGLEIEIPQGEQGRILGEDFKDDIRKTFTDIGAAFSLGADELLVDADDVTNLDLESNVTSPHVVKQPASKVVPREPVNNVEADSELDEAIGDLGEDLDDISFDPFGGESGLGRRRS